MPKYEVGRDIDMLIAKKVFGNNFAVSYSSDIYAALRILDKLRTEWPEQSLVRGEDTRNVGQWECCLARGRGYLRERYFAEAETLALATCRAALLVSPAVAEEREEK